MWKLWKTSESELESRVRVLEANDKAQTLEIDKLFTYVRSNLGRRDRLKALEQAGDSEQQAFNKDLFARKAFGQNHG